MGLQVIQARSADTGMSNAGHGILGPLAEPQGALRVLPTSSRLGGAFVVHIEQQATGTTHALHHKKPPAEAGGDASLVETGGLRD
jgi:hypothetical protein